MYTPDGDMYYEDLDYWCEAVEKPAAAKKIPDRVSKKGGVVISFRSPIKRLEMDRLMKLAETEAKAVVEEFPSRTPCAPAVGVIGWDGVVREPPGWLRSAALTSAQAMGAGPRAGVARPPLPHGPSGGALVAMGDADGENEAEKVWVLSEPGLGPHLYVGRVVDATEVWGPDSGTGAYGLYCGKDVGAHGAVPAKRIEADEVDGFADQRLREPVLTPRLPEELVKDRLGRPEATEEKVEDRDVRVLPVDWDEHNERYKGWRQVCSESWGEEFSDWPIDGPSAALGFCKHIARQQLTPVTWLESWARSKNVSASDRAYHELAAIMESLQRFGSYDQVNIGSLAGIETQVRRALILLEAHDRPGEKPNYELATMLAGSTASTDAMPRDLRTWVVKKAKEKSDMQYKRPRGAPEETDDDKKGDDTGGGGKGGRGRGFGRGKGQQPGGGRREPALGPGGAPVDK